MAFSEKYAFAFTVLPFFFRCHVAASRRWHSSPGMQIVAWKLALSNRTGRNWNWLHQNWNGVRVVALISLIDQKRCLWFITAFSCLELIGFFFLPRDAESFSLMAVKMACRWRCLFLACSNSSRILKASCHAEKAIYSDIIVDFMSFCWIGRIPPW